MMFACAPPGSEQDRLAPIAAATAARGDEIPRLRTGTLFAILLVFIYGIELDKGGPKT